MCSGKIAPNKDTIVIKLTARERLSAGRAEELITEWLDKSIRRQCLAILAGSIETMPPATLPSWGVTLCPNGQASVRLTVGMIELCELQRDEIVLTLHGPTQNAAALAPYLRSDNLAELQGHTSGSAPRSRAPQFPSLPAAVWCRFRARDIDAAWPLVRDSYMRLLDLSAKRPLNPVVRRSHSPGVIDYLHATFPQGLPAL
jgi:hypothetical protein